MTNLSLIVHGPAGCGKTRHAVALAKHFGLHVINDAWRPTDRLPLLGVLALTNFAPPFAAPAHIHRVMTFHEAMCQMRGGRVYLSGPMSGIAEHNFPAFDAEAARLRAAGYEIVNPTEINPDVGASWEQCLRADIKALCDCDTIALMPGWEKSKGAHLELSVAHRIGLRITTVEQLQ